MSPFGCWTLKMGFRFVAMLVLKVFFLYVNPVTQGFLPITSRWRNNSYTFPCSLDILGPELKHVDLACVLSMWTGVFTRADWHEWLGWLSACPALPQLIRCLTPAHTSVAHDCDLSRSQVQTLPTLSLRWSALLLYAVKKKQHRNQTTQNKQSCLRC